jgi:hypothetical protein
MDEFFLAQKSGFCSCFLWHFENEPTDGARAGVQHESAM